MSDGTHIPGMGWWPPKLRLTRSDLCSECATIDFMAAFTTPPDYSSEEKPWTLLVERERLVIDSNCRFCQYLSHICNSIDDDGSYFIVFHDPSSPFAHAGDTQHGKKYPSLDKILISVLRTCHLRNVLQCFQGHGWFNRFRGVLRQNSHSIVCHLNKPARGLRTPQIVPQVLEVSLAKAWLETCTRHHRACRCPINTRLQMPRTRLIDCIARKLINVGTWPFHRPRYAALSYRWGMTSEQKTEQDREGGDVPKDCLSNLPLTIEDAISVTKGLGLRYLWVDQYCIDQNNSKEKQALIQKMNRIYQCAEVTIMAAAGDDCHYGLPGVSKRARQVLDPFILDEAFTFGLCPAPGAHWQNCAWYERGWTFQETYLSRRRLVFSDILAHFECTPREPWQRENSGGVETIQHNGEARKLKERHLERAALSINVTADSFDWCEIAPLTFEFSLHNVAASGRRRDYESCISEYYAIVGHYTMRKLSYASDSLNAFLGLANAMQDLRLPIYNVAGVPFLVGNKRTNRDYWAETSFSSGLAWFSVNGMDRSDQQYAVDGRFPSWSWGNVKLWNIHHSDPEHPPRTPKPPGKGPRTGFSKQDAQLRDIQIEFASDGSNQVIGLVEYAKKSRKATSMSLPQPTALLFKARFVPSHAIDFPSEVENTDQHNITVFSRFRGNFYHDAQGRSQDFKMSLIGGDCNETNSGERYPQGDLLIDAPSWASRRLRLLVHNRKFYDDITASGWSLLLLRCFPDKRSVRLLVIKVLEGNTASRVGIIDLFSKNGYHELDFLQCFTVERDVRLV